MEEQADCDTCPYYKMGNVGTKEAPIHSKTCTFKPKPYEKGRHCYHDVYSEEVGQWVDRREVRGGRF